MKKKSDAKKELTKEKNILSLTFIQQKPKYPPPKIPTVQDLIDRGKKFKTIVIEPNGTQLSRWSKLELSGYIAEEFKVSELRYPTPVDVGVCLIVIKMGHLKTGLKLLDACGFEYRDIFIPQQTSPMLVRMSEESVILRGERDKGPTPKVGFEDTQLSSIRDVAEKIGKPPYVYISESLIPNDAHPYHPGWTICGKLDER